MLTLKPERLDAEDFREQPISVCGKAFIADQSGALYWPAEDALIVADLRLGGNGGETRTALAALAGMLDRRPASTVIALGSSPHNVDPTGPLAASGLESLRILQEGRDWIWVTGGQDGAIPGRLGGHAIGELTVAGITLRPMPQPGHVTHEIAGSLHPAARVSRHSHTVRRSCFVGNGRRLVMPAFAAETGGHNILGGAFEPLFGYDGMKVWMMGLDGLTPIATRLLRTD